MMLSNDMNSKSTKDFKAKKAFTKTSKEYGAVSTAHGFSYVVDHSQPIGERIFWTIVVGLAIVFTCYQVYSLHKAWQDDPVITLLDTVAHPIDEIDFPAVTICPQGAIKNMSETVLGNQFMEYMEEKRNEERSRRRKRDDRYSNVTEIMRELTLRDMLRSLENFMRDVYPGAKDKPTKLIRLMGASDPFKSLVNKAVLHQTDDENCDESDNKEILRNINKKIKGDFCPETFEKVDDNGCIHTSAEKMTYHEANLYCQDSKDGTLVGFEFFESLDSFMKFLIAVKMGDLPDKTYDIKEGEDFTLKHNSPMTIAFCKIEGPYEGDKMHFSITQVHQHPDVLSAEGGRINLIISQEKECTVVVKNAQTKDGGIWKFLIGTMHGTNYREVEQDNNVVISNEDTSMDKTTLATTLASSKVTTMTAPSYNQFTTDVEDSASTLTSPTIAKSTATLANAPMASISPTLTTKAPSAGPTKCTQSITADKLEDCFWYPEFGKKKPGNILTGVHDTRACTASTCGLTNNRIALHFAAKFCSEVCTRLLIDAGSNIDHGDDGNETALDVAINQKTCPVMQILVKAGARYDVGKAIEGFARRIMFACEAVKPKLIDRGTCEDQGLLTIRSRQECIAAGHKAGLTDGGSGEDWQDYQKQTKKKDGEPCGCLGLNPGVIYFNDPNKQCEKSKTCNPDMNCICVSKAPTSRKKRAANDCSKAPSDCQSEFKNAKNNNDLDNFYRRCKEVHDWNAFGNKCELCCKDQNTVTTNAEVTVAPKTTKAANAVTSSADYQVLENSPKCDEFLNENECKEAGKNLGITVFKLMNKGHAPHACHLDTKNGQLRTWWNADPGSYGKVKYKSICKKTTKQSNEKDVWIGPLKTLWDSGYWKNECQKVAVIDDKAGLTIDACKAPCEKQPGCNAFMITNSGRTCTVKSCTSIIPPDRPSNSPGRRTYYIPGSAASTNTAPFTTESVLAKSSIATELSVGSAGSTYAAPFPTESVLANSPITNAFTTKSVLAMTSADKGFYVNKEPLRYWLLNKEENHHDWYESLKKNPEFEKLLKRSGIFDIRIENGMCISLIHNNDHVAPFEMEIVDCGEKRQAVCRKDIPKVQPGGRSSTFPCIVNDHNRRKREDTEDEECDDEEETSANTALDKILKGSNDEENIDEKEDIVLSTNVPTKILVTQSDGEVNDFEEASTEARPSPRSSNDKIDSIENEAQSNDEDGSGGEELSSPIPYTKMEQGEFCPAGTEITEADDCRNAVRYAVELGIKLESRNTLVGPGNWGWVPSGCSYQADGDQAYHFNQKDSSNGLRQYRMICKKDGSDSSESSHPCLEKFSFVEKSKQTALHAAVRKTDVDCVKFFVEAGSEIDAETDNEDSPLSIALRAIFNNEKQDESITKINCRIIEILHSNGATLSSIKSMGNGKAETRNEKYKAILESCMKEQEGYQHHPRACVNGHNIVNYQKLSVEECLAKCNLRDDCLAVEYGVEYGGLGEPKYNPKDCNLQDSDTVDCDGSKHNLDLYVKQGKPIQTSLGGKGQQRRKRQSVKGYAKCPHFGSMTCHTHFEILPRKNFGKKPELQECEKYCDEDDDCKFFYHFPDFNFTQCLRYKSCDKLRKPKYTGFTYSKERNCPEDKERYDTSILSEELESCIERLSNSEYKTVGINARSSRSNRTLLHRAAKLNDIECLKKLIKAGAEIDATGVGGYTPLKVAINVKYYGKTSYPSNLNGCETIMALVDAGADIKKLRFTKDKEKGKFEVLQKCQTENEKYVTTTEELQTTEEKRPPALAAKSCKPKKDKPQSVQSLEVSLDPGKTEEREKQEKLAFDTFDTLFGSLDMEKSYGKLFELLWYGQLPCFNVPGITSDEKDELFLKRCYWKNNEMDCNKIFQKRPTDIGMCCSFNIEKAENLLSQSKYTDSVSELQSKEAGRDISSNEIQDNVRNEKRHRPEAGRNKGLTVIVDRHSDILSPGTVFDSFRGFVTIIDDKDKYPMGSLSSLISRPGYESNIEVNAIQLEAKPEIQKYKPDRRHCYFPDEYKLEMHKKYSQSSCRMECKLKFATSCVRTCMGYGETCNCANISLEATDPNANQPMPCVPWFYPSDDEQSGKMCNPWIATKFKEILDTQIPKDTCEQCLPDCTTTIYSTSMSYAKLPKCDHTNIGVNLLCDLFDSALNPAPWTTSAQGEFIKAKEDIPWYLETNKGQMLESGRIVQKFSERRYKVIDPIVKKNLLLTSQLDNPTYDAYEEDIGIVNVFFNNDRVEKYVKKNRMSNFDFLSQVGGSLGLAMGISIISIIEMVYWCTYRLFRNTHNEYKGF